MPRSKTTIEIGESTYLKRLRFDPSLGKTWIAAYFTRLRLILLAIIVITLLGVASYLNLPRNLFPDIKIPLVIISTVLPGAGPSDVESLVTVPVEDAVRAVQGVKTVSSTSQNSVSVITVEFNTGVDPDKAKLDVQSAVDSVSDLPADAQPRHVQKVDFAAQPVWTFQLVGNSDPASLFRLAHNLKTQLEDLLLVDHVDLSGDEEQEVKILIKPEVIAANGFNPQRLIPEVKTALKSLPAGSVQTKDSSFLLTIDPAVVTIDDLRSLRLNLNGNIVSFGDIFTISIHSKVDQQKSFVASPDGKVNRSVNFSVFRRSGAKIDEVVASSKKQVKQQLAQYNNQFKTYSVSDTGADIDKQFSDLQRDFLLTVFLVTAILFIFLGLRQALVASLTTPLVFFITFIVMGATGVSLSFISVFSLLLSLGLLVDDTIVVISALTAYFRSGKFSPLEAGLLVWQDFLIPVLTTTTTTVWAFLPLLISGGIIGEFIKPIPIVVSTTLIASILVALLITFPLIIFLLKPAIPQRIKILLRLSAVGVSIFAVLPLIPKDNHSLLPLLALALFLFVTYQVRRQLLLLIKNRIKLKAGFGNISEKIRSVLLNGLISFRPLSKAYKNIILSILISKTGRRQAVIMVIILSLFSFSLFPTGLVKNEFFPKTDQNLIFVAVELSPGTNSERSNEKLTSLLAKFPAMSEIKFISASVGQSLSGGFGPSPSGSNNLLFSVELTDKEHRHLTSSAIADKLRNSFRSYQNGKLTVEELSGGPPVGADLQIKLFGPDLIALDEYANKIGEHLRREPGVINVDKSIKPSVSKLVFTPDKQKLADLGIGADQLGFWLRLYASGITADKIKLAGENDQKKEINLRLFDGSPQSSDLSTLIIPTSQGNLPITALGEVLMENSPSMITREAGKRTLSVTAAVKPGFSVSSLNGKLGQYADSLNLPEGYFWKTGGANEENQKSVQTILEAMLLSVLLIIVTMVVQFNSFRRALIVILVIPLSISGVFIIFALTQTALTFPALIGVLALFGIVVKNSILVVDKIVANQKAGLSYVESIADGAASRLEAIALTSFTAIFGLIPITLSDPLWRGLGGAIIAGLTFSGTIMLFFIPVVYYYLFPPNKLQSRRS